MLYAPAVTGGQFDAEAGYGLFNAGTTADRGHRPRWALPPRLFLLTRNAQPVTEGDRANPAHAVLWGLGRTLALEHPEILGRASSTSTSRCLRRGRRLRGRRGHSGADDEDQVVYRAGVRRVARLQRRCTPPAAPVRDWTRTAAIWSIGATGNIGPHLIQQLADMGAATVVAVSRNPGSRLDELADPPAADGDDVW